MTSHLAPDEVMQLLVLAACWQEDDGGDEFRRAAARVSDWGRFVDLSMKHRLIPRAASLVRRFGEEFVAPDAGERLRMTHETNVRRNLIRTGELLRIVQEFDDRGLPSICLKGPTLAHELYGGLDRRQFWDLDLLIEERRVLECVEALRDLGFQGDGLLFPLATFGQRRRLLRWYKDLPFCRMVGELPVHVELHWRIDAPPMTFAMNLDRLWREHSRCVIAGQSLRTLGETERTLYLAYHGAKHRWRRLSWLADLAQATSRLSAGDLPRLLEAADAIQAGRYLRTGLRVLCDLRREAGLSVNPELLVENDGLPREIVGLIRTEFEAGGSPVSGRPLHEALWCHRLTGRAPSLLQHLCQGLRPTREGLLQDGPIATFFSRWRSLFAKYAFSMR